MTKLNVDITKLREKWPVGSILGGSGGGSQPPKEWHIPTLPEFLKEAEKAPRWLLNNWIPEETVGLISGPRKRAFKTWLAYRIALIIASGKANGPFVPTRKGSVLILQEEGQRAATRQRFLGLAASLEISCDDLTNVHFAHHHRVKVDNEAWIQKIIKKVQELQPDVIILDSLVAMHRSNENNTQDMTVIMDNVKRIRDEVKYEDKPKPSIIIISHTNKAAGENKSADPDTQVRGSGVPTDIVDWHIALRRYSITDEKIDLNYLPRDGVPFAATVMWEIINDEELNVKAAHVKITQVGEGESEMEFQRCVALLEEDKQYKLKDLTRIWNISSTSACGIRQKLESRNVLVKVHGGFLAFPSKYNLKTKILDSDKDKN